jgi:D-inositol-3-phosphate glycosyltransferase
VVLVPSRSESFGLVALEAEACGSPVIASAVGGLRYVVRDGITGTVVPGHDPADYATALLALLGDPDRARRLGAAAAEESMPFSWDATASAALQVYGEVTAPAPAGSVPGDGGAVDVGVSEDGDDRRPVGCASGAAAS